MYQLNMLVWVLVFSSMSACLPSRLQKYQKDPVSTQTSQDPRSEIALVGKHQDVEERLPEQVPENAGEKKKVELASTASAPATIYPTGSDSYRFHLPEDQVWDSMINVILKNYNIALLNREQGLVTTEWDTYYLNNILFRNKISARLIRTSRNTCEMIVHNNVEQASDFSGQQLWVPAKDGMDEPLRIIKNIAITMQQPPPQAPPSNVAKDFIGKDEL